MGSAAVSRDLAALNDILAAITAIEMATSDGRNSFLQSPVVGDAALYRLIVIGEAVARLTPEVKTRHPQVDWRGITQFRNLAVHDYGRVNLAIVWEIIERDLPALKTEIEAIYRQLDSAGSAEGQ